VRTAAATRRERIAIKPPTKTRPRLTDSTCRQPPMGRGPWRERTGIAERCWTSISMPADVSLSGDEEGRLTQVVRSASAPVTASSARSCPRQRQGWNQASVSPSPTQGSASTPASVATLPSPSGAIGGIVHYQLHGAPATTEIDAVADGASVSGMAVTAFREGTHTVRLGCAARKGDIWVLGGTTEKSTIHGEPAGTWWRSSSRTARPSRSRSGSPRTPRPPATARPGWRRSSPPSSNLERSSLWSPGR
jgi:hypothetical protein